MSSRRDQAVQPPIVTGGPCARQRATAPPVPWEGRGTVRQAFGVTEGERGPRARCRSPRGVGGRPVDRSLGLGRIQRGAAPWPASVADRLTDTGWCGLAGGAPVTRRAPRPRGPKILLKIRRQPPAIGVFSYPYPPIDRALHGHSPTLSYGFVPCREPVD